MQEAQMGERELVPEGETLVPVDFGPYLDGYFHANRERPTLYFAIPGVKQQLGRLDPFPIPTVPRGHYHVLPKQGAQDQVPFEGDPEKSIFELALSYLEPAKFRRVLEEAKAPDVAMTIPDDVIESAARQYRDLYEGLPA